VLIEWWGARNGRSRAHAYEGVYAGHLDGLLGAKRRQDRAEPVGEHRLARARRPAEQQVVGACRREDQRLHGVVLAFDVAQVWSRGRIARGPRRRVLGTGQGAVGRAPREYP